jgi:hypothetical protein
MFDWLSMADAEGLCLTGMNIAAGSSTSGMACVMNAYFATVEILLGALLSFVNVLCSCCMRPLVD